MTYWDRLGWKDTFAKPQFTERQWQYARAMRQQDVYTPQVVVNGRVAGVGADPGEIEGLISRADRGATGPAVTISRRICRNRRRARARRKPPTSCWSATIRGRSRCQCGAARTSARLCRTGTSSAKWFDWADGTGGPKLQPARERSGPQLRNPRPGDGRRPDPRRRRRQIELSRASSCFANPKLMSFAAITAAILRTRPIPVPRPQSEESAHHEVKTEVPCSRGRVLASAASPSPMSRGPKTPQTGRHDGGPHVGGPYGSDEEDPHEKAYDEGRPHDGGGGAEVVHFSLRARPPSLQKTQAASTI